ncbi:hypothetical protein Cflav_PD6398 [Pedosphaera parvula Ellin514]|uniref:Uncharacterized protein n=1 Tax=Pedosphaera parvula (strain Ellin514) TaxID=320771 RepID=B9XDH7_PEDPL|nr:hypothetical protein Cflav_PD6398 [Pedosphaera parvula Ellin514]
MDNNWFFLEGLKWRKKVGQSILNFFSGEVLEGQHFHLDYFDFEENGILAPTNFHLIFAVATVH